MRFGVTITKMPNWGAHIKTKDAEMEQMLATVSAHVADRAKKEAPVDTGRLRSSIRFARVSATEYVVAAHVHYAKFVEFGTRYMGAQPFLGPAVASVRRSLARFYKAKGGML